MMELFFFFCLLVKHATADLFLQTIIKPPNNKLAWLGSGHKHYRDHAVCNFIVCIFFVSPMWALLFSILDYVIHWHIDWSKTNVFAYFKIAREGKTFWKWQTLDQIAHYATALLIVYLSTLL